MKKSSLIHLGLWLSLILNIQSCSSLPDVPLCTEISIDKGYCVNTISNKEFYIDEENKFEGKTWFEMRPYFIYMPIDSWVKIKAYMLKECKKYRKCGEIKKPIESIDKTINL